MTAEIHLESDLTVAVESGPLHEGVFARNVWYVDIKDGEHRLVGASFFGISAWEAIRAATALALDVGECLQVRGA